MKIAGFDIPDSINRKRGRFVLVRARRHRFWEAFGCSRRGRMTKRDGRFVKCGHRHRTQAAAVKCMEKMDRDRPGNCQSYDVHETEVVTASYKRAP